MDLAAESLRRLIVERQPVVNRAFVVAAVALVVAVLAKAGVVVPKDVAGNLVEVAAVLAPIAVAYWARRHVTPVKDPRDATGNPLAPVADGAEVGRQVANGAEAYRRHADG